MDSLLQIFNNAIELDDGEWNAVKELSINLNLDKYNMQQKFAQFLYMAVSYNDEYLVGNLLRLKDLVSHMPAVQFKSSATEQSLLHMAIFNGNLNIVKLLLNQDISFQEKQKNQNYHPSKNQSLMFLASLTGNALLVDHLRKNIMLPMNDQSITELTNALNEALKHNEVSAANLLIKGFEHVDKLVYKAMEKDQVESVIFMIENGFDVNFTDERGNNLLGVILEKKNIKLAKALIDTTVFINQENAVAKHTYSSKEELSQMLITCHRKSRGHSSIDIHFILQECLAVGDCRTIATLLCMGAAVNIKNEKGQTLLHLAVIKSFELARGQNSSPTYIQLISILLDAGANINAMDDDGETPLFIAINNTNPLTGADDTSYNQKTAAGLLLQKATFVDRKALLCALEMLGDNSEKSMYMVFKDMVIVKNVAAILDVLGNDNNFEPDQEIQNLTCKIINYMITNNKWSHDENCFLIKLLSSNLISAINITKESKLLFHALNYGDSFHSGVKIFGLVINKMHNIEASTINEHLLSDFVTRKMAGVNSLAVRKDNDVWSLFAQTLTGKQWIRLGQALINSSFPGKVDLTSSCGFEEAVWHLLQNDNVNAFILKPLQELKAKYVAQELFSSFANDHENGSLKEVKELIVLARRIYLALNEDLPCRYISALLGGGFSEAYFFTANVEDKKDIFAALTFDNHGFNQFLNSLKYTCSTAKEVAPLTWKHQPTKLLDDPVTLHANTNHDLELLPRFDKL